jgi:hypothetical protein
LQRISVLSDDLLVVAEEYGLFEDSRRAVDLLALDRPAGRCWSNKIGSTERYLTEQLDLARQRTAVAQQWPRRPTNGLLCRTPAGRRSS